MSPHQSRALDVRVCDVVDGEPIIHEDAQALFSLLLQPRGKT